MTEEAIARLCTVLAIVGILLLLLQSPEEKTVSQLSEMDSNQIVSVNAKVSWAKEQGKHLLFELNDGNKITAIISNPNSEQKELLKPGNIVTVFGKISRQKKETVFLAKEIKQP